MIHRIGVAVLLLLIATSSAHAVALKIDINDNDTVASPPGGSQPSPTQSGWVGVTQTGATGVVSDFGTLDIGFVGVVGGSVDDRDRGQLDGGVHSLTDLLRDIVFITGSLTSKGTLDVVVTGLTPGQYSFTGYFHDNNVNHFLMDLSVSSDGGSTYYSRVIDALASTGTTPAVVGSGTFQFVAGSSPVRIRLIGDGGTSGSATAESAIINGFEIDSVSLPALGDFNSSGTVEITDFFILRDHLGTHLDGNYVMHAGGDINFDGKVDLDDFGQFKAIYPVIAAAALAVPEPSVAALATLAALVGALPLYRPRRHC